MILGIIIARGCCAHVEIYPLYSNSYVKHYKSLLLAHLNMHVTVFGWGHAHLNLTASAFKAVKHCVGTARASCAARRHPSAVHESDRRRYFIAAFHPSFFVSSPLTSRDDDGPHIVEVPSLVSPLQCALFRKL